MNCQKCGKCCVNVPMTPEEYRRLAERFPAITSAAIDYGFAVEIHGPCPLLAPDHSCTAYEYRARVCRMFPVVVTGRDEGGFTMGPSDFCMNAATVTPADIEAAKKLRLDYNAEMARSWQAFQRTNTNADQMALNFLASRQPWESNNGSSPDVKEARDALVSVVDNYEATLVKRRKKA
nr:YkgJ family cysteine cluster protein [Candidatus Sigynarchaeota archaeon]